MADTAWVYVICDGATARISRASQSGFSVTRNQPGEYVVSFLSNMRELICVATLNSSVGVITAIPGDSTGLDPNQVRVFTGEPNGGRAGAVDFSLAVHYERRGGP